MINWIAAVINGSGAIINYILRAIIGFAMVVSILQTHIDRAFGDDAIDGDRTIIEATMIQCIVCVIRRSAIGLYAVIHFQGSVIKDYLHRCRIGRSGITYIDSFIATYPISRGAGVGILVISSRRNSIISQAHILSCQIPAWIVSLD